jgi:hypothetical protein
MGRIRRGPAVKAERRQRAEALKEERAKRTAQEQLNRLDGMFGKGKGAAKERARLSKQVEGR